MDFIKLYPKDNVVVAATDFKVGDQILVDGEKITLINNVPRAHKIAICDLKTGDEIIKYENVIGMASQPIQKGEWIHMHNIRSLIGSERKYSYHFNPESVFPGRSEKMFMGYHRKDGGAGIRNYVAIISTVFCANGPQRDIYELAKQKYAVNDHFDGFLSFTQEFGCSQTGTELEKQAKTIAGVIRNANFGGVLMVSLGCEVMEPKVLEKYLGDYDKRRIKYITTQAVTDEKTAAMQLIDEIMKEVAQDHRTPINIGRLHIGMNCGGSDGYSGITANKVLGTLCDTLVKEGASVNMTEVPEMMGAEHILMNRCADQCVYDKMVKMMNDYYAYFERYGENVNANATQGNHAGGLSTLEDKSLGCIQKGGHCAVMDVLDYGERAKTNGFQIVCGPGNDLAGITAQVAAGAVLIIFTTGRGTPTGFSAPTFRISSNSALASRKPQWIDYDAGRILDAQTQEEVSALDEEL